MEEEKICRLCLNLLKKEFEVIDAVTRQMLEALSMKVDLNASKNPMLCQGCVELTKQCYFFKSTCLDTEELILSFSATKETTKFDIKDVYEESKGVTIAKDSNICRFCMNQVERSSCVSIDVLMNNAIYVKMLPIFMPKMVLNIIKDPVICTPCRTNLECYLKFTQNCLDTEEKINKYRQNETRCSTSQIKLSKVLAILFKDTLMYPDTCAEIAVIKQENTLEDVEDNVDIDIHQEQIKIEELLVKNENGDTLEDNICKAASEVEMYNCGICSYKSKKKKNLKHHMLVHKDASDVEMYKCETCTYETKYKSCLRTHMLIHKDASEVEMYKCETCTYETKYKKNLKSHIIMHKDSSEIEMQKCGICTFETKHKKHLKCHILIHKDSSEVKMYKCGICTYETKFKYSLTKHMVVHKETTEVEMYQCGICTYKTKFKNCLIKHMVVHKETTEVEMYQCEICTHETKYKNNLKNHMLKHKDVSEVEMHKCGICTYETKQKRDLKSHMIKHKDISEVKMHKCEMCTYESKYKMNLKMHTVVHKDASEVEMHKCGMCTFESKYKMNLKTHMVVHRNITKGEKL